MSKGSYYPRSKAQKAGPGDMLKQFQQVQQQIAEAQETLGKETVEYVAGGGVVKVVADGNQNIQSITIDPQVLDPNDVSMLEDLVLVAVNGAVESSKELASRRMEGLTGGLEGLGIPGL
ncbi:MAG: YbaB/EbfC family nucleoid-associated protein [Candidatus Anoxymicrobium japonicum]|uniref:Nucleoid-associated protein CVT63_02210 n=1 Tax=Candidatus Anoxymicrobium japonicum TaxID=2013648 RepID=A0A2N3G771_9ACTN|nr:MAG: YbaB/EbfC family nucleoid-associated protein [Candidatus Anoxymicrobium japonicum]